VENRVIYVGTANGSASCAHDLRPAAPSRTAFLSSSVKVEGALSIKAVKNAIGSFRGSGGGDSKVSGHKLGEQTTGAAWIARRWRRN